jgi:GT2 family glycosyltransferase
MLFRREVFDRVGGFREEIGRVGTQPLGCEETELSIRARRAGYSVWYLPQAVVHHVVPASRVSFRYFVRRCYAEGISKAFVSKMAGHDAGLSSERAYVLRTLPHGVMQAMRDRVIRRALAIVAGVVTAGAGFVRGSVG